MKPSFASSVDDVFVDGKNVWDFGPAQKYVNVVWFVDGDVWRGSNNDTWIMYYQIFQVARSTSCSTEARVEN
jgi:hypothetical protein